MFGPIHSVLKSSYTCLDKLGDERLVLLVLGDILLTRKYC